MTPRAAAFLSLLPLLLAGCLDDSSAVEARRERKRRETESAARMLQLEDDVKRLQDEQTVLKRDLVEERQAADQFRTRIARAVEDLSKAPPRREAAAPTPVRAPAAPKPPKLAEGADPDVAQIQTALRKAGYDPGPVDGKIGDRTKQALQKFQKDNGLEPDGVAGPRTRAKLLAGHEAP